MTQVAVYNQQGEKIKDLTVNDAVFGATPKQAVVHQVYTAIMANAREAWAHTKNRGEVRGGGRKPWKQKGTGRARHGSIRSPIWKGGGVTFGPRNDRNYTQKINKKTKHEALIMCLSDKVKEQKLIVIDAFLTDGKTKSFASLLSKLPLSGRSVLAVTHEPNAIVDRAVRNISTVDMVRTADVNVANVIDHQFLLLSEDVLKQLEARLA